MKSLLVLAAALTVTASPASASLVFLEQVDVGALGFGNAPRALTISTNRSSESGCIGLNGDGSLNDGTDACISNATIAPNGVGNTGGNEDNPLGFPKQAAPTLASLGFDTVASLADIRILFNAVEPQNDGGLITLNDLTLKFFGADNQLVAAIDTGVPIEFDTTFAGNGNAGFVFGIDATQQALLAPFFSGFTRMALEATASGNGGGAESFIIYSAADSTPVDEPAALGLLGLGVIGLAASRRRRV